MIRFSSFLTERAIPSGAETKGWKISGKKYFENQSPKNKQYKLAKSAHGIGEGSSVQVVGTPYNVGQKMHVDIVHPETKAIHSVSVDHLHKPIESTNRREKETTAFNDLSSQIEKLKKKHKKDHVLMTLNGVQHKITGVKQIPGNPKADFALVNDNDEHVYHISHKDGSKPTDHQGYLTSHSDIQNTTTYKNFTSRLASAVKNKAQGLVKNTVGTNLDNNNEEHKHVIRTAVFGKEYKSKKTGVNNVDHVAQGNLKLTQNETGSHELSSDHDIFKGDELKQKYVMFARHAGDRNLGGTNIQGRVFVHASGARKINTEV